MADDQARNTNRFACFQTIPLQKINYIGSKRAIPCKLIQLNNTGSLPLEFFNYLGYYYFKMVKLLIKMNKSTQKYDGKKFYFLEKPIFENHKQEPILE